MEPRIKKFAEKAEKKFDKRSEIFFPKQSGLTGDKKPQVVIIMSSADEKNTRDPAVDFKTTKELAGKRGYTVLNADNIVYNIESKKFIFKEKSGGRDKFFSKYRSSNDVVLWLESHGAPGWLFSSEPSITDEKKAVATFKIQLKAIESAMGLEFSAILLNSCYSACEISTKEGFYLESSARLLSAALPEINVVGAIGSNSSVRISGLYDDKKAECTLPIEKASILFKAGDAKEYPEKALYLKPSESYFKPEISKECGIDESINEFYQTGAVKEAAKEEASFKKRKQARQH